jgi:hypothetical protein
VWPSSSAAAALEGAVATDARALADTIDTYLPLAFFYHDDDRIMVYLRRVQQVVNMKAAGGVVDTPRRLSWIRLLLTQLIDQGERLPMHVQIKM